MVKNAQEFLVKFTKSRERAFCISKSLNEKRAKSISAIIRFLQLHQDKPESLIMKNISSIKNDLLTIIPDEKSRFQNQRKKILELLNP